MTVFTIGHSTRPIPVFIGLLRAAGVDLVVDVRAFPRSRTNPHYNIDRLPAALAPCAIAYRHLPGLGGRRHRSADAPPSRHGLWREASFRNYADYAETAAFRQSLAALIDLAGRHRPAIMCSEAVWWRCHRRIIADYLIAAGIPVRHILSEIRIEPARLTAGARIEPDGTVAYPAEPAADLFGRP